MIAEIIAAAFKIVSQLLDLNAQGKLTQAHIDSVVDAAVAALHTVPPPKETP